METHPYGRLLIVAIAPAILFAAAGRTVTPPEPNRSPIDVALSADGRYALSANATSDSVALCDLEAGRKVAEVPVGRRPFCIAWSRDGRRAIVTNQDSNTVSILGVDTRSSRALRVLNTVPVGDEPRGVALSNDGSRAYVCLAGDDALAVVDMGAGQLLQKAGVGVEPWHLALTPDGSHIAVGNARSQDLTVLDSRTLKTLHNVRLKGHNVRHIAIGPDGAWAYCVHIAERGRPATKENIDLGWVLGSRLSRAPLNEEGPREAIALDVRGKAAGDVDGVALSPNGQVIVVSAGGTHEILVFHLPLPFVAYGGPGDHLEKELLDDPKRFRRIPLGGRPLGVRFRPDGQTVVVANYLSNALQVANVETGQIIRTVALGGPETPGLARRGEMIFHDATRSFNQWYSCNSCHTEGHTNGSTFDTFNDGSYGTPKKTLSLRGVTKTGPWTWHGWQKSLRQLVHDSMTRTMQGPEPTDADLDAVLAFLETLDWRPNPHRRADGALTPAQNRGQAVFNARGCNGCHTAPNYTSPLVYSVGMEVEGDPYKGFNPPSLRGVYARSPYLHAGQAPTLEQVLTKYHRPSQLNGKPDLNPQELADLVEFLRSL